LNTIKTLALMLLTNCFNSQAFK